MAFPKKFIKKKTSLAEWKKYFLRKKRKWKKEKKEYRCGLKFFKRIKDNTI